MKLGPHPAHSRSLIDGSENDDEMSTMRQTTHPPRLSVRFPARPSDVIDGNFLGRCHGELPIMGEVATMSSFFTESFPSWSGARGVVDAVVGLDL